MQMNEKVLTALEVLKDCAENDFERHRIDVLIKDLTDPPKVEVIDEKYQKFNDVVFRLDKSGHYAQTVSIYKSIWQYHFGEVPEGYVIHHLDFNPANNNITNLTLMTESEHRKLHHLLDTKRIGTCKNCGKSFYMTNHRQRYCSSKCHYSAKYKNGKTIPKKCPACGKIFLANETNGVQTFCSRSCASSVKNTKPPVERICTICGKTFMTKPYTKKQTCSSDCARKLGVLHRKKN